MQVRIATWNLLHGMAISGSEAGNTSLAGIHELAHLNVDILALQEVDRGQERSSYEHLTHVVSHHATMPYWYFVPTVIGTPGLTWQPASDHHLDSHEVTSDISARDSEPHYGISLLSKFPLSDLEIMRFKPARIGMPLIMPNGKVVYIRDEPRLALIATALTNSGPLHIATTHLSFVPVVNARSLRKIATKLRARAQSEPALLMGDLNLPGNLPQRLTKLMPLAQCKTFPNGNPKIQFDHILGLNMTQTQGDNSRSKAQTLALSTSDHQLLLTELDF